MAELKLDEILIAETYVDTVDMYKRCVDKSGFYRHVIFARMKNYILAKQTSVNRISKLQIDPKVAIIAILGATDCSTIE